MPEFFFDMRSGDPGPDKKARQKGRGICHNLVSSVSGDSSDFNQGNQINHTNHSSDKKQSAMPELYANDSSESEFAEWEIHA